MSWSGRDRKNRELDEEIRTHIEMDVAERVARGESRRDAERAAWREFGNEARVREVTRMMWGSVWIDRLAQDLRYGVRSLLRNRGLTYTAVAVTTIGIGGTAAVFTLSDRLLGGDAPGIAAPEELVAIRAMYNVPEESVAVFGEVADADWEYPNYRFMRESAKDFAGVMAFDRSLHTVALGGAGEAASVMAQLVSDNYFDVLGTPIPRGRAFLPEEGATADTHPVVVLSHGLWHRRFGGDPAVVGRTVQVNGRAFIVVGVAAEGFRGVSPTGTAPDLYLPIAMQEALAPETGQFLNRVEGSRYQAYRVVARLAPGMGLERAQERVDVAEAALVEEVDAFSGRPEDVGDLVVSSAYQYPANVVERLTGMLRLLWVVVIGVLLIGSGNLAILLLARASSRVAEMEVRTAIGAGRPRLLRQLMTENLLLGALGAAGGLALAWIATPGLAALLPYDFKADFSPDLAVAGFSAGVALVVTLLFGLAPALRTSRADIATGLRSGRRTTDRGVFRGALVVGQVTASTVLVVGAGLFLRSLVAAEAVDLGFAPEDRMIASVQLANHGYDESRGRIALEEMRGSLERIPGVDAVTHSSLVPFQGMMSYEYELPDGGSVPFGVTRVGPGYFDVVGTPIVSGRPFNEHDGRGGPLTAIVSETTARILWPGVDPLGKDLVVGSRGATRTVVGVAADVVREELREEPGLFLYSPEGQAGYFRVYFIVRSALPPETLAGAIVAAIGEVDPAVAVAGVRSLSDIVDEQSASYRSLAVLLGAFGLIALLLAAIGLYGVQAYLVAQRSREIGIRMALGATTRKVANAVLGRGARLALVGLAIGGVAALALSDLLRSMLFGIEPNDPATLVVALLALLLVALVASWVPAWRASRVDVMVAIRAE